MELSKHTFDPIADDDLAVARGGLLSGLLGQPLSVPRFVALASAIAESLARLHATGLIHRDVKPESIIVDEASGRAWLTGLDLAISVQRHRPPQEPSESIAGTLPYMAPEQTGRMNRAVDSRSDLYSVGVVFYEMLTGVLPFEANDTMGWVHCHIARQPVPAHVRDRNVPPMLSQLVSKLLAKNAEDRYQTAVGVAHDLELCRESLVAGGRIDPFPLARRDASERLFLPQTLYGRAPEIRSLLEAFERVVTRGGRELVLVSGYSGIGKSSVVNELQKALVPPRALFAAGKFDQYKRDIPYATLAQAFGALIRQLLAGSDDELTVWRTELDEALGPHARLIANLIPELEIVIGESPPVPELSSAEAQVRFQLTFRRFVGVFARAEHPLALFLDDLQWLDTATLVLLEHLATSTDVRHLLIVGAYRDNEVGPSHPLVRTIAEIRSAGTAICELVLNPLARTDIVRFVSDALRVQVDRAVGLGELVHEKTGGNPFFAIQFFTALVDDALLVFEPGAQRWRWNVDEIRAKGFTDNVVDLVLAKLGKLPASTRDALVQLACLGNTSRVETLAMLAGGDEGAVRVALGPALELGLVLRARDHYSFLHDRVQEASYALLPEAERAPRHLGIGRALLARADLDALGEDVFEIANQLDRALALIDDPAERARVARLNSVAGKRARASSAYSSARAYFAAGCQLLAADGATDFPDLAFSLEHDLGECEFLTGDLVAADDRLALLAERPADPNARASVAWLRVTVNTAMDRSPRAVQIGLSCLDAIGIVWPPHPTAEQVEAEYDLLKRRIGTRAIAELVDVPRMTDPERGAVLDLLMAMLPPAIYTNKNLTLLVLCRMAAFSIEHGNTDASSVGFAYLGMYLGPNFGDYAGGYAFAKLGLDLIEKRDLGRFRARVFMTLGYHVMPWTKHLGAGTFSLLRRTYEAANEVGDVNYVAYYWYCLVTTQIARGTPLAEIEQDATAGLAFVEKTGFGLIINMISVHLALVRTLRGATSALGSFDDATFDETRFEDQFRWNESLAIAGVMYWTRKLQARFFAGDHAAAIAAAERAEPRARMTDGHLEIAELYFYAALARAARADETHGDERSALVAKVALGLEMLEVWERNCPENWSNRAALVRAELARLDHREGDAERSYELAIRSAKENGFVHNEAIAHEAAARFFAARGLGSASRAHLRNARNCYERWGATGKVRQLDALDPRLGDDRATPRSAKTTVGGRAEELDLAGVIEMSQAISSEMVMERLVERMMRIAMRHAGATRCVLSCPSGGGQSIEAEATVSSETVSVRILDTSDERSPLPLSLVQYVARSHEAVLIDDAYLPGPFASDAYLNEKRVRSVLCLPLVKQAKLIGVLFLENELTTHAFTAARIAMLKLLASQTAISFENARLFAELERENAALDRMRAELAHVSRLATLGELTASITHEVSQPLWGVVANASTCMRWLDRDPPQLVAAREAAARIVRDGQRAADVIVRLRGLFKKDTGVRDPVDLNDVIQQVVALTQRELRSHRVVLCLDFAPGLPAVLGNRVELQQAMLNLIMNAGEAMATVIGPRELAITTRPDGNHVLVAVRDSGVGFAPSTHDKLFEAFYTTKSGGMGMGLSITRSIVTSHGGHLRAEPNDGPGATFHLALPVAATIQPG